MGSHGKPCAVKQLPPSSLQARRTDTPAPPGRVSVRRSEASDSEQRPVFFAAARLFHRVRDR
jgi:hypothetical protein